MVVECIHHIQNMYQMLVKTPCTDFIRWINAEVSISPEIPLHCISGYANFSPSGRGRILTESRLLGRNTVRVAGDANLRWKLYILITLKSLLFLIVIGCQQAIAIIPKKHYISDGFVLIFWRKAIFVLLVVHCSLAHWRFLKSLNAQNSFVFYLLKAGSVAIPNTPEIIYINA